MILVISFSVDTPVEKDNAKTEWKGAIESVVETTKSEKGKMEQAVNIGNRIADMSQKYVGHPYVWGAVGPNCFDCSGFALFIHSSFGIMLPRTARQQYHGGTRISVQEAINTPGALIFYHNFGHVAISLGDGRVCHASNRRVGVIISRADYSCPCGATRYF